MSGSIYEYNKYFNESQAGGSGTGGLSSYTISLINGIPPSSWQYVSTMNQHVATSYAVNFAKLILGNGSNVAPSLVFSSSPTTGLYLGSSNTPTFNTQISSNGYKITSDTLPTILGYGISSTLQSGDTIIGQSAGSVMTGNNNTAVGVKALNLATAGDNNTACGWWALARLVNDGFNTAYGALALQTLTGGVSNIGLGYDAGLSVQTGISSIFIGDYSGLLTGTNCDYGVCIGANSKIVSNSIAIGFEAVASTSCVALGYRALKAGTNIGNTALGNLALTLNTTGYYNTGIGNSAFGSLLNGFQNTGVGSNVLPALTTGRDNTACGQASGGTVQTGDYNTFLGSGSQAVGTATQYGLCLGYNTQTDSYGIALGANAVAPANGCVIGSANVTTTRIYGRTGINQAPDAVAYLAITGSSQFTGDVILKGSSSGTLTISNRPTYTSYSITMPPAQGLGSLTNDGTGTLSWGSQNLFLPLISEYQATKALQQIAVSTCPFFAFYPVAGILVKTIRLWIMNSINAIISVRVAIYSGTTLLNQASHNTPTNTTYVGQFYVPFPDTQLTQGNEYYMAIDISSASGVNVFGCIGSGSANNTYWYQINTDYQAGFPASRPTGTTNLTERPCVALLNYAVSPIP